MDDIFKDTSLAACSAAALCYSGTCSWPPGTVLNVLFKSHCLIHGKEVFCATTLYASFLNNNKKCMANSGSTWNDTGTC